MTRAAEIRTTVLAYAEQGLAEEEIAREVGIPARRVLRLLDTVEAPPVRKNEVWTPTKPRVRNSARTSVQYTPRIRKPYQRDPNSRAYNSTAPHGTESGYMAHKRAKEKACRPCTDAASKASNERHNRPGGKRDRTAREAAARRYHRWLMEDFPQGKERKTQNAVIRQTLLTPYTANR